MTDPAFSVSGYRKQGSERLQSQFKVKTRRGKITAASDSQPANQGAKCRDQMDTKLAGSACADARPQPLTEARHHRLARPLPGSAV